MMVEPYLCLAGTELANGVRTMSYLAKGLGGAQWLVHVVSGQGGYSDIYSDIYEAEVEGSVGCPCSSLGASGDFVSPETDEAPWFLASRPESGRFLGFIPDLIDLAPVAARAVSPRADFGGVLGPLRFRHRVIAVSGVLVAADRASMAWGERWITEVLRGSICESLRGDTAEIVPVCPDTDDEEDVAASFRTLRQVGLIDGPVFAPAGDVPACFAQRVSFQLAAGNPYMHTPVVTHIDQEAIGSGETVSTVVATEEWIGDTAVVVSIKGTTDLTDVVIEGVPMADDQECPQDGARACVSYSVPTLDAATTLTLDAVDHLVTLLDESSNAEVSGFASVDVDGPFAWLELPPCSRMCVSVSVGTGSATVSISSAAREL